MLFTMGLGRVSLRGKSDRQSLALISTSQILLGLTCDFYGSAEVFAAGMLAAGLIQIIGWHYSTSYAGIVCFATAYGLVSPLAV